MMRNYFNFISVLIAEGESLLLHLFLVWDMPVHSPFPAFLLEAIGRVVPWGALNCFGTQRFLRQNVALGSHAHKAQEKHGCSHEKLESKQEEIQLFDFQVNTCRFHEKAKQTVKFQRSWVLKTVLFSKLLFSAWRISWIFIETIESASLTLS